MKRILQVLLLAVVLLNVQVGAAAGKVWADSEFDLASVHRLYIADMNYAQMGESPQAADIFSMFSEQGAQSRFFVLPQADLNRFLLRDVQIDLAALTPAETKAAVKAHLNEYVDAYVVPTIVHNSRVVIFYDVYSAQSDKMVFSYQALAGRGDDDNIKTYSELTKDFYQAFEKEIKAQSKQKNKK